MKRSCLLLILLCSSVVEAEIIKRWDFTQGAQGWTGNSYVEGFTSGPDGLTFASTGIDPWIEGPAIDLPNEGFTRVTIRMKSEANAGGELFYGRHFEAGRSVQFNIRDDGQWHDCELVIRDPLGVGTRFRLDPATESGRISVRSIEVESVARIAWPKPAKPKRLETEDEHPVSVISGQISVDHFKDWGQFQVKIDGVALATGYQSESIGIILDGKPQWLDLDKAQITCHVDRDIVVYTAAIIDSRGGRWEATRRFRPGREADTIAVETAFTVDADREVIHLPWLTLFPGLGTFGAVKTQAIFPGLEYLADEPSSSQADITTPEHIRRVPDPIKITLPMMAIAHEGRYVGLLWKPSEMVAAVFDSPDTIYDSGAHVMALSAPAVGEFRFENDMVASKPFMLKANQPIRSRAMIIGGHGDTVIPALQKYVELRGLPEIPDVRGGLETVATLLAHGWLDSAANENGRFRHAVWGTSFGAVAAADVPVYMDWLANWVRDPELEERLRVGRAKAMSHLSPGGPYLSSVSHVRTPAPPLVLGGVASYVRARVAQANQALSRFDDRGIKRYQPGKIDYGRTHFADHANGLAAPDLVQILEAATLSADPGLVERSLALLDKQTVLYANTVPRGAQTWEVPLHTPDILASAHLVKAYTLGYTIARKPEYLEQARYWAWTGVPFVYLINPTGQEIGSYATIAVLGGTNWRAPIWFGQPVQWCGLVYGSALHGLSAFDPDGPWKQIAMGITATGLQMTWPATDAKRQGLLPDYLLLRAQHRDGPAINPGTVQSHVPDLFGQGRMYDVRKLTRSDRFIHAPCAIGDISEEGNAVRFAVDGLGQHGYFVLVSGGDTAPSDVTIDATNGGGAGHQFDNAQGLLVISVTGPAKIEVVF